MTNAQMDVLSKRLSSIETRVIRVETILSEQVTLLQSIAESKIDVSSLRNELDRLKIVVQSIKDEVNI